MFRTAEFSQIFFFLTCTIVPDANSFNLLNIYLEVIVKHAIFMLIIFIVFFFFFNVFHIIM